jgi:hypothetical protein
MTEGAHSMSVSLANNLKRTITVATFECACGFAYNLRGENTDRRSTDKADRTVTFGPIWEKALSDLWVDTSLTLEELSFRLCGKHRDEQRIKIEAKRLGLQFPRRYKTCRPAMEYHKRKRISKSSSTGVRQAFKALRQDKRHGWLKMSKNYPGLSRTEIRERVSSLYKWLNKNDHKWLQNRLPLRRDHSFDWIGLDDKISQSVLKAVEHIEKAETMRRITLFALGQESGFYDYLRKCIDRLPQTAVILRQALETRIDFTIRKIRNAVQMILAEGMTPTRLKILQIAKISRDLIYVPLIQSEIDNATLAISISTLTGSDARRG